LLVVEDLFTPQLLRQNIINNRAIKAGVDFMNNAVLQYFIMDTHLNSSKKE
jgi:hypothetical protein